MAVRVRGKYLVIDFRCYLPDGRRVRCTESEGLNNKKNLKRVQQKNRAIQYHLKEGSFDYLKFFPLGPKAKYFQKSASDMIFDDWWDRWISTLSIKESTERCYQQWYKKIIKPHFGQCRLADISQDDILVFRRSLESQLAPTSINSYLKALCQPLKAAMKKGLILEYPCEDIGKLKENPADIDPFSFDELKHWLNYLAGKNEAFHDLILFWSRTGLRPGELYALRWENVDFFNSKALIRENRPVRGGSDTPKTQSSIRDVDLQPTVIEALKSQESRTLLMDKWVWMNRNLQWNPNTMGLAFRHWLKMAGIKHRPPKMMRHTFATLHLAAGENITWVSKMLGHSDSQVTWKKYNRFIPNLTRNDGSAFEALMGQNGYNLVTSSSK